MNDATIARPSAEASLSWSLYWETREQLVDGPQLPRAGTKHVMTSLLATPMASSSTIRVAIIVAIQWTGDYRAE